jgi:DNA-binding response OmpR family regulator
MESTKSAAAIAMELAAIPKNFSVMHESIVRYLARSVEPVTASAIAQRLYGFRQDKYEDPTGLVRVHMWKLRKRLETTPIAIESGLGRGGGYRLVLRNPL